MIKLTQTAKEKIKELKQFFKTTKRPDECDRARAILKLIEGNKRQEVSSFFDIHVKTLDQWQRQFKRQGIEGLRTVPQRGNTKKLSRDQKEAIKATLTTKTPEELGLEGKFWTVPSLKQYVRREYHVVYQSAVSYQRLFYSCGFSYHKGEKVNKKQNPHMRKRFEDTLKKARRALGKRKWCGTLVADECRVERESGVMRIWYPRGKQPTIKVEQEKEAVSFYGALNVATGKGAVLQAPRQKSSSTVEFLRKLEKTYTGKRVLLLWDGAPWHKGKVKDYLKEKNKNWWLEIMYFPSYSPDMNPQEHVWKRGREACTHNSEDSFETKVHKFYRYLITKKFRTNFLQKYLSEVVCF